ncbi:alkaline phosphatase family protein [Mycolicibacterium sp. CH28]|uniref:alkaline phosphatase family protein n=1 Tax=Mycolicibacterium sp. CH28 TaxID=2512237 RepID=UPI0013873D85|nr:alkaline phosphatase family protein [Mycolicibacterium sp. CH28]
MQGLQSVDRVLTRMFDSAGAWVDGLPACGVTDLLQGALLLARNTWQGTYTGLMQRFGPALYHVPQYDHVVVVVLENHSFQEIRGIADTNQTPVPYLNDTLVPGGALMTASYGLQHPSQPNYYWLFSGSNQGITTDAPVISNSINTVNSTASNLYTELQSLPTSKSFGGYVEGYTGPVDFGIPSGTFSFTGTIASANGAVGEIDNVERHVPWAGFANVPQDVTASYTSFGPDYSALPDVSFVIPALQHDMHNYGFGDAEVSDVATSDTAMANSDAWLQQNIDGYAQWARTHNSLLIITTDEDSSADWLTPPLTSINYGGPSGSSAIAAGAPGFTSAAEGPSADANNASGAAQSGANQIFTLFYGAYVVPGEYSNPITNVNVLRTVEASMGISTKAGAQPDFAGTTASGAHDPSYPFNDAAVTNVFSIGCR